ncbi:MAG TPA: LPS export ABC transporter periplasmic protein LptC [Gallionella sp.]|nr:LPS export ABC transporter periplasmic protein LptC [Gallionella sp.]
MTLASRVRPWLPLLPLLGLLSATYWLNQQALPGPAKPESKNHDPDAVMENFSATNLNEQGLPDFIMAATKLMHYPDDDSTTLDDPRVTMLSPGKPDIHITAEHGTISSKGEDMYLRDNVKVLRAASAQQGQMTLQTQYLHIAPNQDLADTDRAVTIVDPNNIVHAIGMEMNSKTRILKLLSQVRSEYVPNKP